MTAPFTISKNRSDFFPEIKNREERSSVYNNLTSAYKLKNNIKAALECNAKALSLTNDEVKRLRNYAVRGQLFAMQMQYDSALFYLEQASRSEDKSVKASAYFKLADLPEKSGITDSMKYRYLQEAYRLSDSIENMAVSHQIDRQEQIRITSDLKEQSHIRLIVSITVSIIVVLLLSITVFFFLSETSETMQRTNLRPQMGKTRGPRPRKRKTGNYKL